MKDIIDLLLLIIILGINIFILMSFIGIAWGTTAGAPFVPSNWQIAKKMIELANIQKGEKVFDLGSGDGRLVFLAADKGASATGVEISWLVWIWSKCKQKVLRKKGILMRGSLWKVDISDADVVFTYLLPKMMVRFEKEVYPTLKKGCRFIAHGFPLKNHIADHMWKPKNRKTGRVYVYVKK